MYPRTLTATQYQSLLANACRQEDFVHIGGTANMNGSISGFSACAVKRVCLNDQTSQINDLQGFIDEMELAMDPFVVEPSNDEYVQYLIGGWMGYLSYEVGYLNEPRLRVLLPELAPPLMSAGLYLWSATYNHRTNRYFLWIHPQCPDSIRQNISDWLGQSPLPQKPSWRIQHAFTPRQIKSDFKMSVQKVKEYIEAGDCYQANLSQEFTGTYSGDPWAAFQALSQANPTPYSAFIRADNFSVVSLSPERFLEIDRNIVKTSPIKGTRPRGGTPQEDVGLAQELQASEKDRAENLMIVDLLRNDLGLNARTGSVRVDELFALESYRNVHHLVSHIQAELADGVSPLKALFDAFPGGSITGAPKVRAMEIIRELEPHWRGPYCGSVFYYGLDGRLDSSIAIRTLLCDESTGTIRCWGGGGIVADSDPEAEYQETLAKVGPLMRFLEELEIG